VTRGLAEAPLIGLAAFVAIEARATEPLLPLWVFGDRNRAGGYVIQILLAHGYTHAYQSARSSSPPPSRSRSAYSGYAPGRHVTAAART
jgi:hypothetical protein